MEKSVDDSLRDAFRRARSLIGTVNGLADVVLDAGGIVVLIENDQVKGEVAAQLGHLSVPPGAIRFLTVTYNLSPFPTKTDESPGATRGGSDGG